MRSILLSSVHYRTCSEASTPETWASSEDQGLRTSQVSSSTAELCNFYLKVWWFPFGIIWNNDGHENSMKLVSALWHGRHRHTRTRRRFLFDHVGGIIGRCTTCGGESRENLNVTSFRGTIAWWAAMKCYCLVCVAFSEVAPPMKLGCSTYKETEGIDQVVMYCCWWPWVHNNMALLCTTLQKTPRPKATYSDTF